MEGDPTSAPQISLSDLEGFTDGLIALTGGPSGSVGRLFAEGQKVVAEEVAGQLQRLFPNRLYVELMRHGLEIEDRIEPDLVDLAYRMDLPLVATNDCFFATDDMYEAHDALLCIAEGAYVAEAERRRLTPEHRFKSAAGDAASCSPTCRRRWTIRSSSRAAAPSCCVRQADPARFTAAAEGGRRSRKNSRRAGSRRPDDRLEQQVSRRIWRPARVDD